MALFSLFHLVWVTRALVALFGLFDLVLVTRESPCGFV